MATLDLSRIEQLAKGSPDWEEPLASLSPRSVEPLGESVRVGVAHDPAFCFYYPDNLAFLEEAGGELVRFSPMQDTKLPEVDILYLGGGYLEVYASVLQQNSASGPVLKNLFDEGGSCMPNVVG